jgi:hypothetical protein
LLADASGRADNQVFGDDRCHAVYAVTGGCRARQRWLLKFWQRHLGDGRVPKWQVVETENLSNIMSQLSFLDVVRSAGGLRFMVRFHGTTVGEVYDSADWRGKFLDEIIPNPAQAQAPYLRVVQGGCPVYTIHDVIDRDQRIVHYERLLLPFGRDSRLVARILASFEFVCAEGAFNRQGLMVSQAAPPKRKLLATIEPRAMA